MSLTLTRKCAESVTIGPVTVTVVSVRGQTVRLAIDAPPEMRIGRTEPIVVSAAQVERLRERLGVKEGDDGL